MNEHVLLDKKTLLYDSLMVFLNLSASYSIIPYLLFFQNQRQICFLIIVAFNFIYITMRFKKQLLCREPLFVIYILMHLVSLSSALLLQNPPYSIIAYLFLNSSFYYLLFQLNNEYKKMFDTRTRLWYLTRGYIWIVLICLMSCFILLFLSVVGVNLRVSPITSGIDLFSDNIDDLGASYYRPYFLGIVHGNQDVSRFDFFQRNGIICGIYHEPHILAQMTFPCLPLLLYLFPKRRMVTSLKFLLIMLIAGSTMNILAISCCCLIYVLWKYKTSFSKGIVVTLVIAIVGFVIMNIVGISTFDFVFNKLNMDDKDSTGSLRFSVVLLNFAFAPKTLLGTSFYDTNMIDTFVGFSSDKDVGYINYILNIVYLSVCISYLFKQFKKSTSLSLALLISGSYFLLHSAKLAMITYSLTLLIFIMFLVVHVVEDNNPQTVIRIKHD